MEYLLTFLEGFASFISPCLLPMLPIYISYFMGDEQENRKKAVLNSIGFVSGFTLVFLLKLFNISEPLSGLYLIITESFYLQKVTNM